MRDRLDELQEIVDNMSNEIKSPVDERIQDALQLILRELLQIRKDLKT